MSRIEVLISTGLLRTRAVNYGGPETRYQGSYGQLPSLGSGRERRFGGVSGFTLSPTLEQMLTACLLVTAPWRMLLPYPSMPM